MTEPRSRRTFPDAAARAFRLHALALRKAGATSVTAKSGVLEFTASWETPPDKTAAVGFGFDHPDECD